MSMLDWARKEVEIRKAFESQDDEEDGFNYGGECLDSALRAFESLCGDGHSGMSIGITKMFLNRLIDGLPLMSIEDIPENWGMSDVGRNDGELSYQCNRYSALFQYVKDGEVVRYLDVSRYTCIDINNGSQYSGGGASDIIDALYPITLPYWPMSEKIKLYTEDFLVDPKFGDYDTKGYLYLIHPTDGRVEVNRFFKETEEGWKEIDHDEYKLRKSFKLEKEETSNE